MTRTPCPAGQQAALALRLSEAALDSSGWNAVAAALDREAGPGFALRFQARATLAPSHGDDGRSRLVLCVPDLGTWTADVPDTPGGALALSVPLRDSLALAQRLADGLPLAGSELEAVLDPLPYAVVFLDAGARFLFANAAGDDLLASRRLFRPTRPGTPLRATRHACDQALETALARILHEGAPGVRGMVRGPDGGHLMVHLRPLGHAASGKGAARVLLTMRAIGAARKAARPEG